MNKDVLYDLGHDAIELLKKLIAIPSYSREEDRTAQALFDFFTSKSVNVERHLNNVYAFNKHYDASKPTILLNSHHDTVKPASGYTKDPFKAELVDDKLYGLGSNDAGGPLVSLIATFLYFYNRPDLKYNLIIAATAEEEVSGSNGIESLLMQLPAIDCAIVGEPTQMKMAIAEKGLMVLDVKTTGKAGHAARGEGVNAIYLAADDINWFREYRFDKESDLIGPVKMTVTSIETPNKAHNVVPGECSFIVDVRINEHYTHEEVLDIIRSHVKSEITPRSTRLKSSSISIDHPLVKAGITIGLETFGSSTLSDCALLNVPALKLGPGESARSHTSDEYIYIAEIRKGIEVYAELLNQLL
ncbi:MAG TPA: M20 family metallo-hydrolase [Chitinophagaceae bacterium]